MPTLKLIYFNLRGRGEIPRLMMKAADIEFEDHRIEHSKWRELKKTFPQGKVPILEVDGAILVQSGAITNYIAREAGYYGSNNWEASQIDAISFTVLEHLEGIDKLFDEKAEPSEKEKVTNNFKTVKIPKALEILETILKENEGGDGFFVGKKISLADFGVFVFVDDFMPTTFQYKLNAADHPKLAAHVARMKAIPKIKDWLEKRPVTEL